MATGRIVPSQSPRLVSNRRIHAAFSAQELRPVEIWTQCIFEACQGPNYMAELLDLTMVSKRWSKILMNTPTLWGHININELNEDSEATIALFLYLSGESRLRLTISIPLSSYWYTISKLLLPHNTRIRTIALISNEDEFHMPGWQYGNINHSDDAEAGRVLKHVLMTLNLFEMIQGFEVTSDIPVRPDVLLPSPAQLSTGNWLIRSAFLGGILIKESRQVFLQPRQLIMGAADLLDFGRYSSMLGHLNHLSVYSKTREYIEPPPTYFDPPIFFHLPFLTTLHYHARFQPELSRIIVSTHSTLKFLNVQIGILDVTGVVNALKIATSLRSFTLTLLILDYDQDSRGKKRPYYPMTIVHAISRQRPPSWRLLKMEIFKCEIKHFEGKQIPENLNVDYLWKIFHSIFPNLRHLVWNLPMQSRTQLLSLARQNQLTCFESTVTPPKSYNQWAETVLSSLESLSVNDVRIFDRMIISNLAHLSMKWSDELEIPAGISLMRLESLLLAIGDDVKRPVEFNPKDFPLLKSVSITLHGPESLFKLPNLPNLIEIKLSTRSPALTQGMKLCASLIWEPEICPKLEKIHVDSLIQWDILFVLLKRRNFGQNSGISKIRELGLPQIAPHFRHLLTSLLKEQETPSDLVFYRILEKLSNWQARHRLLDENITGCVYCVYMRTPGCPEVVKTHQFPSGYGNNDRSNHHLSISEFSELFSVPQLGASSKTPIVTSSHDQEWMEKYTGDALAWKLMAQEWSKLHHRTFMCHKRPSAKIVITDQDTSLGEPLGGMDLESQLTALESVMKGYGGTSYESDSTAELMDTIQSCLGFIRLDLAQNASPGYAALLSNPSFFSSFVDSQSATGRAVVLTLKRLVENDAFRAALLLHIAGMLMNDKYDERRTGIAVMVEFKQHTELLYETEVIISKILSNIIGGETEVQIVSLRALSELVPDEGLCRLIGRQITQIIGMLKDEKDLVQPDPAETRRRLTTNAGLHLLVHENFPQVFDRLQNEKYVRSNVVSALAKCAEHAELRSFITPVIPRVVEMLKEMHSDVEPIVDILTGLVRHAEFRYIISSSILQVVEMITDEDEDVRSHAIKVLRELTKHTEFDDAMVSTVRQTAHMREYEADESIADIAFTRLARFDMLAERAELRNLIPSTNDLDTFMSDDYLQMN